MDAHSREMKMLHKRSHAGREIVAGDNRFCDRKKYSLGTQGRKMPIYVEKKIRDT